MPTKRNPRRGSMQFWPRKRAADIVARIRNWPKGNPSKALGFAGYKVGMAHIVIEDNVKTSMTKGEEVQVPVTIVECPPLKVAAILFYAKDAYGLRCVGQLTAEKLDKELSRKITVSKKKGKEITEDLADVRILAYTQPKKTTIGKKKPELLELGIGGKIDEKVKYAKEILGKEINVADVFAEGTKVDIVSITKGKGFQGPVKRMGVKIRSHKSEKTKRGPGSLGPWHGERMYRVAHAGQTGFQQRTEHNKYILKIDNEPGKINPKSGFARYGLVKNNYILLKGSVGGARKRLVTMTFPRRETKTFDAPPIVHVSTQD